MRLFLFLLGLTGLISCCVLIGIMLGNYALETSRDHKPDTGLNTPTVTFQSGEYRLAIGSSSWPVLCDYSIVTLDNKGRPEGFTLSCTGSFSSK